MVRFLFALTAVLLVAPAPSAAQVAVGARTGLNVSTLSGQVPQGDVGRLTGFFVGGTMTFTLTEQIYFELGLASSPRGATVPLPGETGGDADLRFGYLDLPVHIRIELAESDNVGVHLIGGSTLSFNTSCEVESEDLGYTDAVDCEDPRLQDEIDPVTIDYGFSVGGGVSVAAGDWGARLVADLLYTFGMVDVTAYGDARHRVLSLLAGFRIPAG